MKALFMITVPGECVFNTVRLTQKKEVMLMKTTNTPNKTDSLHLFEFIIMFILFYVGLATRQVDVVILNKEFLK